MRNWIGIDFDRTLAVYESGDFLTKGPYDLGEPIPKMVEFVKRLLKEGKEVRIMTARVLHNPEPESVKIANLIEDWCEQHIGQKLQVTCIKDSYMEALYDDKTFHVIPNTGEIVDTDLYLQYKAFWLEKGN